MSTIGQVDPRIQAMFDENLAKTRSANSEVTAKLKADQDRLAAQAKALEEKHQRDIDAARQAAENVGKQAERQPRKPQWEQRDRSAGELAFGPEDDDNGYAAQASSPPQPPAPVTPPPPPPLPPARSRRPAPVDDDDDDLSGTTWLR